MHIWEAARPHLHGLLEYAADGCQVETTTALREVQLMDDSIPG